ncbi:hypothetical protein D3C74_340560 [compost metagenome]
MNVTDEETSILSALGDVKTAARSLNWRSFGSSNKQARKASASSRESAATTKALLLGFSSQVLNVSRYAVIEGANISGVRRGSLVFAQLLQACSSVL